MSYIAENKVDLKKQQQQQQQQQLPQRQLHRLHHSYNHKHQRQETHRIYLQQRRQWPHPDSTDGDVSSSSLTGDGGGSGAGRGTGVGTLSAAVRLTDSATSRDVTQLLRKKFRLGDVERRGNGHVPPDPPVGLAGLLTGASLLSPSSPSRPLFSYGAGFYERGSDDEDSDALVLVGTLYHLPPDHVQFFDKDCEDTGNDLLKIRNCGGSKKEAAHSAHNYNEDVSAVSAGGEMAAVETVSSILEAIDGQPHHCPHRGSQAGLDVSINIVRTLRAEDNPLEMRDSMMEEMRKREANAWHQHASALHYNRQQLQKLGGVGRKKNLSRGEQGLESGARAPMIRWFYQPGLSDVMFSLREDACGGSGGGIGRNRRVKREVLIRPAASIDLDGYCTAMEEGEEGGIESSSCSDNEGDAEDRDLKRRYGGFSENEKLISSEYWNNIDDDADLDVGSTCAEAGVVDSSEDESSGRPGYGGDEKEGDANRSLHVNGDGYGSCAVKKDASSVVDEMRSCLLEDQPSSAGRTPVGRSRTNDSKFHPHYHPRASEELRRKAFLGSFRSAIVHQPCVSGFLLKRSRRDRNVWRRVHCTLVDNKLWYAYRMKCMARPGCSCTKPCYPTSNIINSATDSSLAPSPCSRSHSNAGTDSVVAASSVTYSSSTSSAYIPPRCIVCSKRISRHGYVNLLRAQVVEPTAESSSPLSSLPHAMEIRTSSGKIHHFRARRRDYQLRWIQALADRIVTCHEDGYIDLAELIVTEEEDSRCRRMEETSLMPCIEGMSSSSSPSDAGEDIVRRMRSGGGSGGLPLWSLSGQGAEFVDVVRFAALVQEFREACRHHEERVRVASNYTRVGGSAHNRSEVTTSVKTLKAIRKERLNEQITSIERLWKLAASVCSRSDFAMVSWSDEEGSETREHALRAIDTLRAEITFKIQENIAALKGPGGAGSIVLMEEKDVSCPPPRPDMFEEMLKRRMNLVNMAENRYRQHGLFGHTPSEATMKGIGMTSAGNRTHS